MDTSVEVSRPTMPFSAPRGSTSAVPTPRAAAAKEARNRAPASAARGATAPTGASGRSAEQQNGERISVDPLRATDRYRLVMPSDLA